MLPVAYRDELERIVFFNPEQGRVTASLLDSVRRYGGRPAPTKVDLLRRAVEDGSLLRFRVPAFGTVQSLFALDESEQPVRLAGVGMFVRETADTMRLLHVAIHEDYAGGGDRADAWVTPRLMAAVWSACRRTRGITTLHLPYPREAQVRLQPAG